MTKNNDADYAQMYAALKEITQYQSVESLRRHAEKDYGLHSSEAIEMAYENVLFRAKSGLRKVRKP